MLKRIVLISWFICLSVSAQKNTLADTYFKKGEYQKAAMLYKPLHEENPIRQDYFKRLLSCYQLLEEFDDAEQLIDKQQLRYPNQNAILIVERGYNYQLQGNIDKANLFYNQALDLVRTNNSYAYVVGHTFRNNHLLDEALKAYRIAKEANPALNTEFTEAQIYGEKGEVENMFNAYLNLIDKNEKYYKGIQRYLASFIGDNPEDTNNVLFKKLLLKRSQNNPKDEWNKLLSWLYMQQKEYTKAFIQEKSLFRRHPESINRIIDIGSIALYNKAYKEAKQVFQFIKEQTNDQETRTKAEISLLEISSYLAQSQEALDQVYQQFNVLLAQPNTNLVKLNIQIAYAEFLAFSYHQPQKAVVLLEEIIPFAPSKFSKAKIQIQLADILVFTNQFNQALLLYTQVQTNIKNSVLAQEARFKVAKTSYYKGDFDWAKIQLKVLKSSTSQLIANDALKLNLLINNNTANDTVKTALKLYAKADLLQYQNQDQQAIDSLQALINQFKTHEIIDDALFKQALLFEGLSQYAQAEKNYLNLIENHSNSVLIDDTYFALGNLYQQKLDQPEKAKAMYQKIIFNHQSSIYLVDARKQYRLLRGDPLP